MNTIEQLSVNLFDKMFDRDIDTRIKALKNEFNELIQSYELYKNEPCPMFLNDFKNELADVQSIITHLTSILDSSIEEQLLYTNSKLLSRIEISKYRGRDFKVNATSE